MNSFYFFLLVLVGLFFGPKLHSQTIKKETDSLTALQKKTFIVFEKDLKKVERLLVKTRTKYPDSGAYYYQIYLERGLEQDDLDIQLISYYYLADIAYEKSDFLTAIQFGKSLLQIAQSEGKVPYEIIAVNQLGNAYYQIRDYDNALQNYLNAYQLAKDSSRKDLELQLLTNISNLRTRIHRYEDAVVSYQKIIALLQKKEYRDITNRSDVYLSAMVGNGVCYFKLGRNKEALTMYEKGMELAIQSDVEAYVPVFHLTMGEVYSETANYKLALEHLYKAKDLIHQDSEKKINPRLHTANFHLATVFFRKQEYSKALDLLSESFDILKVTKNEAHIEKIGEMYDLAYLSAKQLGNKELQIRYAESYRRVVDSFHLDDIKTKDRLYDQDMYELQTKNNTLSAKNMLYAIGICVFFLVMIGLLIFNFKRQQKNKKLFNDLQLQLQNSKNQKTLPKEKKTFVTDEKASTLLEKLEALKQTHFYLDEDCNRYTTAKLIDTNTTYLSKLINEYEQKSFNSYINELRINYYIQQLRENKKFQSYTIKAMAEELGYKSVNTFAAAFKKQTGISHSYYLKQILKNGTKETETVEV